MNWNSDREPSGGSALLCLDDAGTDFWPQGFLFGCKHVDRKLLLYFFVKFSKWRLSDTEKEAAQRRPLLRRLELHHKRISVGF